MNELNRIMSSPILALTVEGLLAERDALKAENKALRDETESAAAILELACKWGERSHPMDAVQNLWTERDFFKDLCGEAEGALTLSQNQTAKARAERDCEVIRRQAAEDEERLRFAEVEAAEAECKALKAEIARLTKDARCASVDPKTGYRCELGLGHGCELHGNNTFTWADA